MKTYSLTKTTSSGSLVSVDVAKTFTQRGVRGIYIGLDDVTKGHLIFLPQTLQIISSLDIKFDEHFLSALIYKNCSYRKAILTRLISESIPSSDIPERTGDISASFLSFHSLHLHLSSTNFQLEDKNHTCKNSLESFNESIEPSMSENIYDFDTTSQTIYNTDHKESEEESEINLNTTNKFHNSPKIRQSIRPRKSNFRFSGKEWINTASEIKEENTPWSTYGDHTQYLPEPKGLKNMMRLETLCLLSFKLWSRAIRGELRNLITRSTFLIEDAKPDDIIKPTSLK